MDDLNIGIVLEKSTEHLSIRPAELVRYYESDPEEYSIEGTIDILLLSRLKNHERNLPNSIQRKAFTKLLIDFLVSKNVDYNEVKKRSQDVFIEEIYPIIENCVFENEDRKMTLLASMDKYKSLCQERKDFKSLENAKKYEILDSFMKAYEQIVYESLRMNNLKPKPEITKPTPLGEYVYADAPNAKATYETFITRYWDSEKYEQNLKNSMELALLNALEKKYTTPDEIGREGIVLQILDAQMCIPYKELYGSDDKGTAEFRYTDGTIDFTFTGFETKLKEIVPDFDAKFEAEADKQERFGYGRKSLPKLRLNAIDEIINPISGNTEKLKIDFGTIDFFSNWIARDWWMHGGGLSEYLSIIRESRGNVKLNNLLWSMCGCGVWIVTSDNMLLVSQRTRVSEEPQKIGYSAAGSCDRYIYAEDKENTIILDANPFLIIDQEIRKETGLKTIDTSILTLVSLGIDLTRCLIQFSFFTRIKESAQDALVIYAREAQSAHEQRLFAIPFKENAIKFLLRNYEMESGAVVSLFRIINKGL